jgi:hypothetical protein
MPAGPFSGEADATLEAVKTDPAAAITDDM